MSNTHTTQPSLALLPTVRNLEEARAQNRKFASVLTAGPDASEVRFNHPDHLVVTFDDVSDPNWPGYDAPTFEHVREMMSWGHGRENLLVHCHAGISRSTATAWGIAISNGFEPEEAYELLKGRHPMTKMVADEYSYRRGFYPNELIVVHLERLFGFKDGHLSKINEKMLNERLWLPSRKTR